MTKLRTYKKYTAVHDCYAQMHKNQTLRFANDKRRHYSKLVQPKMTIKQALAHMDDFIDPSDPDLDLPNLIHAYQTAERIRQKYPDNKELQIVGLIHDLGKVLFLYGEPSWAVVGDTYVLGCSFPSSIVYYDSLRESPEFNKYDKLGIYKPACGLDNLTLSYGHDEYLYQVLLGNKNHRLSKKNMDIIRYHSFYPWHTSGEYRHLMAEKDSETLKHVLDFNGFDLYSKVDNTAITTETRLYYDKLLDEFFDGELSW